jgi:hypothetical protein
MGLDMYLRAKKYFCSDNPVATQIAEAVGVNREVSEVSYRAMYWRKANCIHQWFVDEVQEGEDNCRPYELDREKLVALVDLCKRALTTKNATLLPTISGCFFGSTEVDEYYWEDLQDTVNGLTKVLEDFPEDFYFEYQASW